MKSIEFEKEILPEEIVSYRIACSNRGNWSGFVEFADGSRISFKDNAAKAIVAPVIFARESVELPKDSDQ